MRSNREVISILPPAIQNGRVKLLEDILLTVWRKAIENSVYLGLFVWLLYRTQSKNEEREVAYQKTINDLGNMLSTKVDRVEIKIDGIKENIKASVIEAFNEAKR